MISRRADRRFPRGPMLAFAIVALGIATTLGAIIAMVFGVSPTVGSWIGTGGTGLCSLGLAMMAHAISREERRS